MPEEEQHVSEGVKMPSEENKEALGPQQSKLVRIFTVFIYFGAVSGAAFMLSLYYIFLWNPEPHSSPFTHDHVGGYVFASTTSASTTTATTTTSSPLLRTLFGDGMRMHISFSTFLFPLSVYNLFTMETNGHTAKIVVPLCLTNAHCVSLYHFLHRIYNMKLLH